jgi:hypothetical protein
MEKRILVRRKCNCFLFFCLETKGTNLPAGRQEIQEGFIGNFDFVEPLLNRRYMLFSDKSERTFARFTAIS